MFYTTRIILEGIESILRVPTSPTRRNRIILEGIESVRLLDCLIY
ncbi:hypothetical protein J5U23_01687 [Saccharolobus shibatae B12]|uniref:Uncharacterized protein n=1 Tax=Saccharolobus shibatae (strain ATCC 51178 / DSM 5389 / JCM 8931 / NBRC 15437 / B12) TaxID=523848 RepID=A0A8F5BP07_SACSH|nr:hypothetical protein J5U23_01687 [Saccharolobus shibatae B12]